MSRDVKRQTTGLLGKNSQSVQPRVCLKTPTTRACTPQQFDVVWPIHRGTKIQRAPQLVYRVAPLHGFPAIGGI